LTHFVIVWRRHGPLVQVMDPGVGRRWLTGRQLLEEVYVHTHGVPAAAWHEWAVSDGFRRPLARRLADLGPGRESEALIEAAAAAPGWRPLAALDAATRLVAALVRAGGLRRGGQAEGALRALVERAAADAPGPAQVIPDAYWSVQPAPAGPD